MSVRVPIELLACPACGGALRQRNDCPRAPSSCRPALAAATRLCCAACGLEFPVLDGVPILMTPEDRERFGARLDRGEGAAMAARYGQRESAGLKARLKRALTPPLPLVHNPAEARLACPPGSHNLWIGGGGASTPGFFNLDVSPFPGVDVVANVERLPFRDATLDSIECDAVLEHVARPDAAGHEMHRALKPGGMLHAVVPFCHPYHAYPADFRRWTVSGFADWVAQFGFDVTAAGVRTGPTATLLTLALEYLKVLFGAGTAGKAAYAAAGWLLFPLRYLDVWLNRTPRAAWLANHVFVLARKPTDSAHGGAASALR